MASKHDYHKAIIGRAELLSFIGLELQGIPAKTDTGAYRSAMHARDIRLNQQTGELSFLLLGGHPLVHHEGVRITTRDFKTVIVENSFGEVQERYRVSFKVRLGPKVFTTTFSLTDRSKKLFPILLGRKLLNHRFLVDPSHTSLDKNRLRADFGIELPDDNSIETSRQLEWQLLEQAEQYKRRLQ